MSPALRAGLEADVIVPALLFEFSELGGSAVVRAAGYPHDVEHGGEVYPSESNLIGMSVPEGQLELGRNLYALRFAGGRDTVLPEIPQDAIIRLRVLMLLRSEDGSLGEAFDVYSGFSGQVQTTTEGDGIVTTVQFVGDLNDVSYVSVYVLTESGQAARGQGDTSLRYMNSIDEIEWGRP